MSSIATHLGPVLHSGLCCTLRGQMAVCPTLNAPEHWDALVTGFLSPPQVPSATSLCSLGRMETPGLVVPVSLTPSPVCWPSPSLLSSFSFSYNFPLRIFVFEHCLVGPAPLIWCSAEELARHISSPSVFLSEVLIILIIISLMFRLLTPPHCGNCWKQQWKITKRIAIVLQDMLYTRLWNEGGDGPPLLCIFARIPLSHLPQLSFPLFPLPHWEGLDQSSR